MPQGSVQGQAAPFLDDDRHDPLERLNSWPMIAIAARDGRPLVALDEYGEGGGRGYNIKTRPHIEQVDGAVRGVARGHVRFGENPDDADEELPRDADEELPGDADAEPLGDADEEPPMVIEGLGPWGVYTGSAYPGMSPLQTPTRPDRLRSRDVVI